MTQLVIIRQLVWLIAFAFIGAAGIQLEAQTVEQLRDELNRDNQLQALQRAWDGHDSVRTLGMQAGEIEIWDYASGQLLQTLHGHAGEIKSMEFTADGRYLVSRGSDNRAALWSLATGLQVWAYTSDKPIEQLQFDALGQNLGVRTGSNSFQVLRGKP